MPTPIAASDLPFSAQEGRPTLQGEGIGPVMLEGVVRTLPDTVIHLPPGQSLAVQPDSLIHLLGGQPGSPRVAWETRYTTKKATVFGPALVCVEKAAAASARLGTPITATSYTLADRKRKALFEGSAAFGLVAMCGAMWALLSQDGGAFDMGRAGKETSAVRDSSTLAEALAPTLDVFATWTVGLGVVCALFFVLQFAQALYALVFPKTGGRVSVFVPFPGALARRMGADLRTRSEHPTPDLREATPDPTTALLAQASAAPRLVAEKALPGVPASVPLDTLVFVEQGQSLPIAPGSIVSLWRMHEGAPSRGEWIHTHVESSGVLHGPALVGVQAGSAPSFRDFARSGGAGTLTPGLETGLFVMIWSVFLGVLFALVAMLSGSVVGTVVVVALFAAVWSIGQGLRRHAHRHRVVCLDLA